MGCDIHLNLAVQHPGGWCLVAPPQEPAFGPESETWPRWPGAERDYRAFALLGYTGRREPIGGVQLPTRAGWPDRVPRSLQLHPAWDEYDHNERWIDATALAASPWQQLVDGLRLERRFPAIATLSTIVQHYAADWHYSDAILIFGFDN